MEKGTGKEKQQEQQERAKHGPGARDGEKVTAISFGKKPKTVPWTSSSLCFIPSFSSTACFLLEKNSAKKTLMH